MSRAFLPGLGLHLPECFSLRAEGVSQLPWDMGGSRGSAGLRGWCPQLPAVFAIGGQSMGW